MKQKILLLFVLYVAVSFARADEPFIVSDIRVEGLQRISAASVFTSLPINAGDNVDEAAIRNAIRTLFRTGNFDNIAIGSDGSILVVSVEERPSISEINIEGNDAIETDALLEGLEGAGLAEGKVFKRSTLENMKVELTRQYVSQGRYDAGIETNVSALPRNRVEVNIDIDEGTTASIKHINIVGNSVYDDELLLDQLELNKTGWFSWLRGDDKYSREKLSGDLEKLTSLYQDTGYIKFNIDSTQVSVTPDREAVYITINITEGDQYKIGEVDLSGDIVLTEEQLMPFIFVRKEQIFSQALVTSSEEFLTRRLGGEGYNFAKVEGIPEIDEETQIVDIKFFIDPGKRTYVRRINFKGNSRTADEVLRREMRQMEAAPAASGFIDQSKVRLERLSYFKEVNVETTEVPGTDDMIDLEYTVEEQPSGQIGASVGFSQDSGVLFGASLSEDNFLGSGKKIGISLNQSDYLTNVRFSYQNPYFTKDGVSRGFSVFYTERDLDEINISRFSTNSYGASMSFGYPIKETERLGFSFGYTNTEIIAGFGAVQEILASPRPDSIQFNIDIDSWFEQQIPFDFDPSTDVIDPSPEGRFLLSRDDIVFPIDENTPFAEQEFGPGFIDKHGDTFDDFTVTASWTQSTLNRGLLATRGAAQSVSLELTVPGSDLSYYKLRYNGQRFFPITNAFTLRLRAELGYGDGFGGDDLPFFNHFYSGGFGSVRGFRSNTLGPLATPARFYPDLDVARQIYNVGDADCSTATQIGELCDDGVTRAGDVRSTDDELSFVLLNGADTFRTSQFEREGNPFGGNVLIEGGAELLFPLPFIKDQRSVRSAFFLDAGNVFSTDCGSQQLNCFNVDADELRYSFGVGLTWITGFGPLTFSYAKPLNESEFDETENFQFSLGRSF